MWCSETDRERCNGSRVVPLLQCKVRKKYNLVSDSWLKKNFFCLVSSMTWLWVNSSLWLKIKHVSHSFPKPMHESLYRSRLSFKNDLCEPMWDLVAGGNFSEHSAPHWAVFQLSDPWPLKESLLENDKKMAHQLSLEVTANMCLSASSHSTCASQMLSQGDGEFTYSMVLIWTYLFNLIYIAILSCPVSYA